jgi:hypothetical protein
MPMPDEVLEPQRYDVPRGTCPSCGSGRVVHHVYGMPILEVMETAPAWVSFEGCLRDHYDRSCRACGLRWEDDH